MADFEGNSPTNSPRRNSTKIPTPCKRRWDMHLISCPSRFRTWTLLIQNQGQAFTINDNLPYFRGKPSVGAGLPRHSCRTLPGETHLETHPRRSFNSTRVHPIAVAWYLRKSPLAVLAYRDSWQTSASMGSRKSSRDS